MRQGLCTKGISHRPCFLYGNSSVTIFICSGASWARFALIPACGLRWTRAAHVGLLTRQNGSRPRWKTATFRWSGWLARLPTLHRWRRMIRMRNEDILLSRKRRMRMPKLPEIRQRSGSRMKLLQCVVSLYVVVSLDFGIVRVECWLQILEIKSQLHSQVGSEMKRD